MLKMHYIELPPVLNHAFVSFCFQDVCSRLQWGQWGGVGGGGGGGGGEGVGGRRKP